MRDLLVIGDLVMTSERWMNLHVAEAANTVTQSAASGQRRLGTADRAAVVRRLLAPLSESDPLLLAFCREQTTGQAGKGAGARLVYPLLPRSNVIHLRISI